MNTGDPFYINSDDVEQLIAILKDGLERSAGQDPTIGAIRRLADLKANVAEPWLRRALNHSNITVKTEAALALYKLGDFSAGLDALIALVSDDRSAVSAIRALAKTEDTRAIEALENLKSSSRGRSLMFNGDLTPLNTIIDRVLRDAMPRQFPPPGSGDSHSSSQSKAAVSSPLLCLVRSFLRRYWCFVVSEMTFCYPQDWAESLSASTILRLHFWPPLFLGIVSCAESHGEFCFNQFSACSSYQGGLRMGAPTIGTEKSGSGKTFKVAKGPVFARSIGRLG